jgi:carboxylesterase
MNGNSFFLKGGSIGVLLIHGFTATTFEMRSLADRLNAEGYTVSGPLLPGHGTSPDDLNKVIWQDWVLTCEEAFRTLKKHCDRVFIGGESMGGLLSLVLADRFPEIKGVLLYAPAINNPKLRFTPLLKHFLKYSKKKNQDDLYEWQGYRVNPVAGAAELYSLQRFAITLLEGINMPAIIFQGTEDHTVKPSGAQMVFDRIRSKQKQLVWLKCGHCVLLENEFEKATELSIEFIKNNVRL